MKYFIAIYNYNKFVSIITEIIPKISAAPVYLSFPHFYKADPKLLDAVEGLKPNPEIHETYFKIQPVSYVQKDKKIYYVKKSEQCQI